MHRALTLPLPPRKRTVIELGRALGIRSPANAIARARKRHCFTQHQVAAHIGISVSAVGQWETDGGTRPDPTNARKLMELLPELTFDDIYPPTADKAA